MKDSDIDLDITRPNHRKALTYTLMLVMTAAYPMALVMTGVFRMGDEPKLGVQIATVGLLLTFTVAMFVPWAIGKIVKEVLGKS